MKYSAMTYNYDRPHLSLHPGWLRGLLALAILLITYKSIAPASGGVPILHFDKFIHAAAYALLTGLIGFCWPRLSLLWIAIGTTFYGASLEIIQYLLPFGRTGSLADAIANLAGILFVIYVWMAVSRLLRGQV